MPAPFNHSSGLAGAYDRTPDKPGWTGMIFREEKMMQAAELNELQSLLGNRGRRVGDLVARDGDRVEGADVLVNQGTGVVTLAAGEIYVKGDVRSIAAATLTGVPMTGDVKIGVRLISRIITEVEDPTLVGLAPGSEAEGEPGAAREVETLAWGRSGDGQAGDLYSVYLLREGVIIDQTPPPQLGGITAAIAAYDRGAHGPYVVSGCAVSALGNISGAQHFSIEAGEANINGFKRTRTAALRHVETEAFDVRTINSEPHTFTDGGTGTAIIAFNSVPKGTLLASIITKQKTVNVTKGVTGSQDSLPDTSVTSIISAVVGGTTYTQGADYQLTADKIDWSPAGAEPTNGTTVAVTYRYLSSVVPAAQSDTSVTLAGGVTGTAVFLTYTHKLPRVDVLCLNSDGFSVYLKGQSSVRPQSPQVPSQLLELAVITNDWMNKPRVVNSGIRSIPFAEQWHYMNRLFDALDLIALERLRRDIDAREPVAKKGIFVDPFVSDYYRDAGYATQTAVVANSLLRLGIDPAFFRPTMTAPVALDYTEEYIVRQELVTACRLVNPYQNFDPLPAEMTLTPPSDFWTVKEVVNGEPEIKLWTGGAGVGGAGFTEVKQQLGLTDAEIAALRNLPFVPASQSPNGLAAWHQAQIVDRLTTTEVNAGPKTLLEFLRPIAVAFTIRGLTSGETITTLLFDKINVLPGGLAAANSSGIVAGTFTIPAGVTAGTKLLEATASSGRTAEALFTGQGTIEVDTLHQVVTKVQLFDPVAQTFSLPEKRHITGFDLKFCAKGNASKPCELQVRAVENGQPTHQVLAKKRIDMNAVVLNTWTQVRFDFPLFLSDDREYCFVVLTDDPLHALATAAIGGVTSTNEFVGAQPYSVGVMLTSSNASTWTAHQNEDVSFRIAAAVFSPTTKTVNLGSFTVTNMSDVQVRGTVELPTEDAAAHFEIVRPGGEIINLRPNQAVGLTEYINETVQLRAVLSGSSKVSPVLYPGVLMVAGTLRSSGQYVTRVFDMGTAIRLSNFVKAFLPSGSSLTVEIDAADDSWQALSVQSTDQLNDYWIEREYRKTPFTAVGGGRVRLTITGTPAARPLLGDFRAVAI